MGSHDVCLELFLEEEQQIETALKKLDQSQEVLEELVSLRRPFEELIFLALKDFLELELLDKEIDCQEE